MARELALASTSRVFSRAFSRTSDGQLAERLRHVLVGAQDAQAGAGQGSQREVLAVLLEAVLAVAEEGEVVVGEPPDELRALAHLVGVERAAGRDSSSATTAEGPRAHLLPVLDRLADVAQHALEGLLDQGDVGLVDDPVDLDVHPGLVERVGCGLSTTPSSMVPDGLAGRR